MKICIVGLGYVGLPLSFEFSKFYDVIGYDSSKKRISELKKSFDINGEFSKNVHDMNIYHDIALSILTCYIIVN